MANIKLNLPARLIESARQAQYNNRDRLLLREEESKIKVKVIQQKKVKEKAQDPLKNEREGGQLEFKEKDKYKIWTNRRLLGEGWFIAPRSNRIQEITGIGKAVGFDEEEFAANNYMISRDENVVKIADVISNKKFKPAKIPPSYDAAVGSEYQFFDLTHARKKTNEYGYNDLRDSTFEFFAHLENDDKEYIPTLELFRNDAGIIAVSRLKEYYCTFFYSFSILASSGFNKSFLVRITRNKLMQAAPHPSHSSEALFFGLAKKWAVSIVDSVSNFEQPAQELILQTKPKNHIAIMILDNKIKLYSDGQFVGQKQLHEVGEDVSDLYLGNVSFYFEAFSVKGDTVFSGSGGLPNGFTPMQTEVSADVPSASFSEYRFTPRRVLYTDTFTPPENISGLA